MIRDGRQTCVGCGTRFAPTRPYRGAYCPDCQTTADDYDHDATEG